MSLFRAHTALALVLAALSPLAAGCATPVVPPPIVSKAALGRVIIYRNGVAYFERRLPPSERELSLKVPVERVDDFLKSLTVVDVKTGETMPVSYPTMDREGGEVKMVIKLPERHNGLRISYVTESPAWKPSYRLVLGDDGKAQLQGWAVVDNVSGEDWKHVHIGVGSTSALSFRYDLHSVRLVERETLSSGSLLAVAPPTGGGSYAAKDGAKVRILGNIDQRAIDELADDDEEKRLAHQQFQRGALQHQPGGLGGGKVGGAGGAGVMSKPMSRPAPSAEPPVALPAPPRPSQTMVTQLSRQLRNTNERIRIEGYARADDKDARFASLERANRVRQELIEGGVPAEQIEAVGTGEINEEQAVRVVAVEAEPPKEAKPEVASPGADDQPMGRAHFVSSEPLSIAADHSAMVSILNAKTSAERVYYYDPISERGSKSFAFNAIKLHNPSKYTLDSGPFTVYEKGQFLGEGLAEPILPESTAFIPYALDRTIVVEPEITGRQEIDRLVTIQRGIVTAESRKIRTTKLHLSNRGQERAKVYVRHQVAPEHRLDTRSLRIEKLGGAHLIPVEIPPGETLELVIEEWTPITTTVDIQTDSGVGAIAAYLATRRVQPELKAALADIVERHKKGAELAQRIELLEAQMQVYRKRSSEINVQLVTLRKVTQAAKLRRHLSDKLEEISNKLQDATMEITDLKATLMAQRIELSDKLAELTLKRPDQAAQKSAMNREVTP